MSKIARLPISIPTNVNVSTVENKIQITLGNSSVFLPSDSSVDVIQNDNKLSFALKENTSPNRMTRSIVGTVYASTKRAIKDIQDGFTAKLQFKGVGYKAVISDNMIMLFLGYSHLIYVPIPKDLDVKVTQNTNMTISGADRRSVMKLAMLIRNFRKPEPYKGKGIFVNDEKISIKEGKKK